MTARFISLEIRSLAMLPMPFCWKIPGRSEKEGVHLRLRSQGWTRLAPNSVAETSFGRTLPAAIPCCMSSTSRRITAALSATRDVIVIVPHIVERRYSDQLRKSEVIALDLIERHLPFLEPGAFPVFEKIAHK